MTDNTALDMARHQLQQMRGYLNPLDPRDVGVPISDKWLTEQIDAALAALDATPQAAPSLQEPDAYMVVPPNSDPTHLFFQRVNAQICAEEQGLGSEVIPLSRLAALQSKPASTAAPDHMTIAGQIQYAKEQVAQWPQYVKDALRDVSTAAPQQPLLDAITRLERLDSTQEERFAAADGLRALLAQTKEQN